MELFLTFIIRKEMPIKFRFTKNLENFLSHEKSFFRVKNKTASFKMQFKLLTLFYSASPNPKQTLNFSFSTNPKDLVILNF